jgi:hypothetical protein
MLSTELVVLVVVSLLMVTLSWLMPWLGRLKAAAWLLPLALPTLSFGTRGTPA